MHPPKDPRQQKEQPVNLFGMSLPVPSLWYEKKPNRYKNKGASSGFKQSLSYVRERKRKRETNTDYRHRHLFNSPVRVTQQTSKDKQRSDQFSKLFDLSSDSLSSSSSSPFTPPLLKRKASIDFVNEQNSNEVSTSAGLLNTIPFFNPEDKIQALTEHQGLFHFFFFFIIFAFNLLIFEINLS